MWLLCGTVSVMWLVCGSYLVDPKTMQLLDTLIPQNNLLSAIFVPQNVFFLVNDKYEEMKGNYDIW